MTDRPCLLLLPGLLNDHRVFAPQIAALAPVVDIVVADLTRQDSIAGMAAAALAEVHPQRLAVAGFSMGGYVAFELMRRVPERIERIAFLDTQARPDTAEQKRLRLAAIELAKTGRFKGLTPSLLPQLLHPRHFQDASITGP